MSLRYDHPLPIRLTHWIHVVALAIMVFSGFQIYNASPLFDFRFPRALGLGGWLAAGMQWHFAGMWLFFLNGFAYVAYWLLSGQFRTHRAKYNLAQRIAYPLIILIAVVEILSGLAIYKSVQLSWLTALFGGHDGARYWHFYGMVALILFTIGHLVMALRAGWSTIVAMVTGWRDAPTASR